MMKKTKMLLTVLSVAGVAACGALFAACGHTHEYTESVIAATCTEKGYTLHTCACGDEYKDSYVDELGHDLDPQPAQELTCTQDGWEAYDICKREGCDYSTQEITEHTGHVPVEDPAVEAGCEIGKTAGSHCDVCSEVLVAQKVVPVAHEEVVIDQAVTATCTSEGKTEGKHCEKCHDVIVAQKTVPMLLHDVDGNNICTTCHQDVTTQGLTFADIDGTTCKLTGLGTASTDIGIYIPKEYNGKTVTTIGYKAINSKVVKGVFIPEGVTTLENLAIYSCTELTTLSLPSSLHTMANKQSIYASDKIECTVKDGVKYIGNAENPYVLLYKAASKTVASCEIPEGTNIVYYEAFLNCSELSAVNLPDSLVKIYGSAFFGCTGVSSIQLGDHLELIDLDAFRGCLLVTSLVIPDSVQTIADGAFYGCKFVNLTVPFIGESRDSSDSYIGFIYGASSYTSNNSSGALYLRTLKITDATQIKANALRGLSKLETVILGDKVAKIGSYALMCSGLANVYYEGTEAQWAEIQIDSTNDTYLSGKVLYLSADEPAEGCWHYVGTVPTKWDVPASDESDTPAGE